MSEIEKAIETLKQVSDLDTKLHLNISNYDLLTAIEALREKQEREKGCEWCNGKLKKYQSSIQDGSFARITPNKPELYVLAKDTLSTYFDINYCPMCGRKLGENDG